jgi:transcriptional antiterminator RfaH
MRLEPFLPRLAERGRHRRRDQGKPLFPGYLFVLLSPAAGDLPRVRWLHGVKRVLGDKDSPRPIEKGIVEEIRSRVDQNGYVRFGLGLRAGEPVKVLRGPFAGLIGVLEGHVKRPEDRVHVLLDLFARTARVQISAEALVGLRH